MLMIQLELFTALSSEITEQILHEDECGCGSNNNDPSCCCCCGDGQQQRSRSEIPILQQATGNDYDASDSSLILHRESPNNDNDNHDDNILTMTTASTESKELLCKNDPQQQRESPESIISLLGSVAIGYRSDNEEV
jgi:hypothetical protein